MFEQTALGVDAIEVADAEPETVAAARERLGGSGPHLAWEQDGEVKTMPIDAGWAKIGRSSAADLLLDDPTVSRRHALVVRTDEGELRALDDRSLNGLFVNGERVEWAPLARRRRARDRPLPALRDRRLTPAPAWSGHL